MAAPPLTPATPQVVHDLRRTLRLALGGLAVLVVVAMGIVWRGSVAVRSQLETASAAAELAVFQRTLARGVEALPSNRATLEADLKGWPPLPAGASAPRQDREARLQASVRAALASNSGAARATAQRDLETAAATAEAEAAQVVRRLYALTTRVRVMVVTVILLMAVVVGTTVAVALRRHARVLAAVSVAAQRLQGVGGTVRKRSVRQVSGMREQSGALAQTSASFSQLVQTTAEAAERAREVAKSASAADAAARSGTQAVVHAVRTLEEGKRRSDALVASLVGLAEHTEAIVQVLEVVDGIADRSHLLALNAALEASRAGAMGRGFAVVAREIKEMAGQSKDSTVEVRAILQKLSGGADQLTSAVAEGSAGLEVACDAAEEAGRTIRSLGERLQRASQVAARIERSATQQQIATGQVNTALETIERTMLENLEAGELLERAALDLEEVSRAMTATLESTAPH